MIYIIAFAFCGCNPLKDKTFPTKSDKTFGWLFIGSGEIAKIVSKLFPTTPHDYLAAVYSKDFKHAQKLTKKFGGIPYESLDDAFKDRNVKAVYVATPISFHKRYAVAAIKQKLPVFVEKAFAMNAAETNEIISLASISDVYLAESMWPLYNPLILQVLSVIKEGSIGSVVTVNISDCFKSHYSERNKFFKSELGGGAVLTVGVYVVTLAYFAFGENKPTEIFANATYAPNGVESTCTIVLKFGDEGVANLICSIYQSNVNDILISGTKGTVLIPSMGNANKAFVRTPDGEREITLDSHEPLPSFRAVTSDILQGRKQNAVMTLKATTEVMDIVDYILQLLNKERKKKGITLKSRNKKKKK